MKFPSNAACSSGVSAFHAERMFRRSVGLSAAQIVFRLAKLIASLRKAVEDMRINYDLLNGKVYMEDMKLVVNPYGIDASFIPDEIQHY